jgi:DNA polymerase III alpha subunit
VTKDATFVPLHTKSDRSAGYGTASPRELVRAAARLGCGAVALTDLENLYAQVELHHAARDAGIRAITGVELRRGFGPHAVGEKRGRLVLLARDRAGYESLCRIVTRRRTVAGETGDPLECLEDEPRGIFYLSDDVETLESLLARGVAPDDVRFLLARAGAEPPSRVRAVADVDAVMLSPDDADLHRLLFAIRRRMRVRDATGAESHERALLAPWADLFRDAPDALAESRAVAEACTLDLCETTRVVPDVPDADEKLAAACREAICGRGVAYETRLARELETIRILHLAPYFWVVREITDHARAAGIAIAGRGSAASSLVCFALGITSIDPIVHGLHFERFVHAGRLEPPDIDLDLPSNRRDELVDWVFRRFGRDRVAMLSTHQTFRRRAAYREGLKALGMRREDVDRFCARMTDEEAPPPTASLPYAVQPHVGLIERTVGKLQHVSVHPGGVVIGDGPLTAYTPLERAPKGVLVTQYDLRSIGKLGLLKIDLLGNRALAALEACGVSSAPGDDAATRAALERGQTIGCFQVETAATRSVLRKLPIRDADDVTTALALVRPGPSSGDAKAAFVRRAHGEEPASPPHPALGPLLARTHGMLLFEEDILSAIATLTRGSLEEADAMRAAIVRADEDPAALAEIERDFRGRVIEGAEAAWPDLARFAAYSFSRAHATSYAELAWRSVWAKVHRPAAFACAVLNHYGGAYPLRTIAADFARSGVTILRPDVARSAIDHVVEDGAVRVGLGAIAHLTQKNAAAVLAVRPFADMRDLLARTSLSDRELRSLVLSGACDDLAPLSARGYPIAHEDLLAMRKRDPSLASFVARAAGGPRGDLYRGLVRVQNEVAILGMHVSDHPMRLLRTEAAAAGAIPIASLAERVGEGARIAGIVAASRRIETRGRRKMQFVTLEDETDLVEVVILPDAFASLGDPVTSPGPFLVDGVVERDHEDTTLIVRHVVPFHRRAHPYRQPSP